MYSVDVDGFEKIVTACEGIDNGVVTFESALLLGFLSMIMVIVILILCVVVLKMVLLRMLSHL